MLSLNLKSHNVPSKPICTLANWCTSQGFPRKGRSARYYLPEAAADLKDFHSEAGCLFSVSGSPRSNEARQGSGLMSIDSVTQFKLSQPHQLTVRGMNLLHLIHLELN